MKFLIFGTPGSGKTTFSNRLSKITDIPVFHIDRHFFKKGREWIERPQEDFLKDVKEQLEKDSWIIDGNGMRSLEMRFKEAHLAIFCDFPRLICIFRIFYRWISTLGKEKPDGPEDAINKVSFRILKYLWKFPSRYHSINRLKELYPNVEFIHASSQKDLEHILKRFSKRNIFHTGVYGIIQKKEAFLLVEKTRGPYKGLLDLPGGKMEHGETTADTLIREIKEETGIVPTEWDLFDNLTFSHHYSENEQAISFHHLGLIYNISKFDEDNFSSRICKEDVAGCKWVSVFDENILTPFAKHIIQQISQKS